MLQINEEILGKGWLDLIKKGQTSA